MIKSIVKKVFNTFIPHHLSVQLSNTLTVFKWRINGRPVPPPHLAKQHVLKKIARRFDIRILVETGTYQGDMIAAMKDYFDHIYSIELSHAFYAKAQKRFSGESKITLIQGDSGEEIKKVLEKIRQPALFWLDGHYSGGETARGEKDTPVYDELQHILNSMEYRHVIVIDDARCFGTDPAYPTIEEISTYIKSKQPDAIITIEDDSIRIIPSGARFTPNDLHP